VGGLPLEVGELLLEGDPNTSFSPFITGKKASFVDIPYEI